MANDAWYELTIYSENEKVLKRMVKIMNYEDKKYYLYRVFEADDGYFGQDKDGKHFVTICGCVAWSTDSWFNDAPAEEPDDEGKFYTTLTALSKIFGFTCECYCEESGCEFMSYQSASDGEILMDECVHWGEMYEPESIDDIREFIDRAAENGVSVDEKAIEDFLYELRNMSPKDWECLKVVAGGINWNPHSLEEILDCPPLECKGVDWDWC